MRKRLKYEKWSKQDLKRMLFHNFSGTIADNIIEIGWVLCFSLIADKSLVERITTMFGLNDAFWVVLSSTYYTTRTAMTAILPKTLVIKGQEIESKLVKNFVYLFYLMLFPVAIGSLIYMPKLLMLMGVSSENFGLYLPYFRMSIISILFFAPWAIMVPAYYRTKGKSEIAHKLDHAVAWSMIIGIFITTHMLHQNVLWALIVNMLANALPLCYFIWNQPINNFWTKGFEFSWSDIKQSWVIVKWELVRRLSPRITTLLGFSFIITLNPIYLAIKYWVSSLSMLLEGWVDASAGLLNSHVSRTHGLILTGNEKGEPYADNAYVFKLSLIGIFGSTIIIYLIAYFGLGFLPQSIKTGLSNPLIYLLVFIEVASKLRYYMWLSISRSYRHDLNGIAQLIYALSTIILTPTLLWLFLWILKLELIGIFTVSAIVGLTQAILTEIYFKTKLNNNK